MRRLYIGLDDGFLQHGCHYDIKIEKRRKGVVDVVAQEGSMKARLTYYGSAEFERDWVDDEPRKNDSL